MRRGIPIAAVIAGIGLLASSSPADAERVGHEQTAAVRVVAPRVSAAGACGDVLVVRYDAVALIPGRVWAPLLDDGSTRLEFRDAAGRNGPGRWVAVATTSGGEHVLRWPGYGDAVGRGAQVTLVRVVTDGYRSAGYPASGSCS